MNNSCLVKEIRAKVLEIKIDDANLSHSF